MTRIITIANQKGGVGKTTTVVNVAASMAKAGKRTLVVDLDPQANCTNGLGVDSSTLEFSVYEVLAQPKKFRIFTVEDIIVHTQWPNLEIVPSHVNLSGVELEIVNKLGREAILKKGLREVADRYDFVLIDTPPSLSLLTVNALVAATEVIVVMKAEPWSLDGIDNLLETLNVVEEELNPGLSLYGILVNLLEPRANLSQEILARISKDERLAGRLFSTNIRKNVRLSEAADRGVPVVYHDPNCHGARAYQRLTEEIISGRGSVDQPIEDQKSEVQEISSRELTQQELSHQELSDQELGQQELTQQESGDQELSDRELSYQELGDQELGDQESGDQELGDQELGQQESGDQELGDQGLSDRELSYQGLGDQELGDQELGDQELGDQELGDQELSDQESGDQESGDQELSDWELSYQELSDQELSDRESSDRESSDRELSDQELSDRESSDQEAGDRELSEQKLSDQEAGDDLDADLEKEPAVSDEDDDELEIRPYQVTPSLIFPDDEES